MASGLMLTLAEERAVRWFISAPSPRNVPVLDCLRLKLEARDQDRACLDARAAFRQCECPACSGGQPAGAA